jgi:hypothetical protein
MVLLSGDAYDLLFSFIAPGVGENSDLPCDLEAMVAAGERAVAVTKQKVSQASILTCVITQSLDYLKYDVCHSIETSVRRLLKVDSVPVGAPSDPSSESGLGSRPRTVSRGKDKEHAPPK